MAGHRLGRGPRAPVRAHGSLPRRRRSPPGRRAGLPGRRRERTGRRYRAARRARPAVPGRRRRRHRVGRRHPGPRVVRERAPRGLRGLALQRHADVPAGQRRRRRRHGHHPHHPRRGPGVGHPQDPDDPRRARRRRAAGLRPPSAAGQRAAQEAVQATRRRLGGRLPRPRLPARGHGQLPRPPGLGSARRGRDPPDERDRRALPPRGREPGGGVLRPEEARALQCRVPAGHVARRAVGAGRNRGSPPRTSPGHPTSTTPSA